MDVPVNKVDVFNTALPVAATALFTAVNPSKDPGMFRIHITMSVAGVLSISRTVGAATVTESLNSGNALVAGAAYMFSIAVKAGESITLVYSVPVIGATTVANGTGAATGAPITLVAMSTTIVVTGAGTFTVTLAAGLTGTATSGTATVAGSPQALIAGANTVDTGATTGNFVITLNGGTIKKLQIDESWS